MLKKIALVLLFACSLPAQVVAQPTLESEQTPKYTTDVKLVTVFASVRDKSSSKIITDLTKDNFSLDEEGKPQTIKFFEAESSLPLNLGLCVDTSASQGRLVGDERNAGIDFFAHILRDIIEPGSRSRNTDQGFVLHFDYESELLQDFTGSRDKLDKALNQLEVAQPSGQTQLHGGNHPQDGGSQGQRNLQTKRSYDGTKMYDAILLASDLMAKQQGRKALVLLTGGVDTGSKTTLLEAISAAQKADTMVYSVLFSGPYADDSSYPPKMGDGRGSRMPMPPVGDAEAPDGKKVLQQIAEQTGGRFFSVGTRHKLDNIFKEIEEELRSQYNLGYTPNPPAEVGLYRHIHVTARIKKKELAVQARAGYYAR
jgi:VWFA-related protein